MIRRSWMTGASIEATLELWASSLRDVKGRLRPLFTQEWVAASAGSFVDGLLGGEQRKTGWMRAEAVGDPGPWRQQAILGRGRWDADALRDIVRDYALEALADPDAVLVLDETGFLKQEPSRRLRLPLTDTIIPLRPRILRAAKAVLSPAIDC
jgi:SRSO17 transposase